MINDKYERTVRRGFLIQLRLLQDLEEVEDLEDEGQVHAYDPRGDQLTRNSEQQESMTLKLPDQVWFV